MPLAERTYPRVVAPGLRHEEAWASGSGAYIGEGERGCRPPDRPDVAAVRARIAWHAVLTAARAWGLFWYGGSLRLAEAVGVRQQDIHRLAVIGPDDGEVTALLNGVERLERRARIARIEQTLLEPRALQLAGGR